MITRDVKRIYGLEIHYATSDEKREREYLVAAPRGGFEPGVFEIAHLIASCGPYLYYLCKPEERTEERPLKRSKKKPAKPAPIAKLASAQVTTPDLKRMASRIGRLVVVRGYHHDAEGTFVLLGGGDDHLKDVASDELAKAGFVVNPPDANQPVSAENICNRGRSKGMQITLSRPLGENLLKDHDRAGVFVYAVVEALNLCRSPS